MNLVSVQTAASQGSLDNLLWLGVALLIWCFEQRLRGERADASAPSGACCQRLLRRFAPEVAGLAACAALAAVLLSRGEPRDAITPGDEAAWEKIKNQWPLLMTADSLLALQAMFRLVLLVSALLRFSGGTCGADISPITGEPALLFLAAGVCRVALLAVSPDHGLEGPLQGPVHLAFEAAALPLLLRLCTGPRGCRPTVCGCVAAAAGTLAAAWLSTMHRLPLADDLLRDSAFTMVQLLEFLACAACLIKTVATCWGPWSPYASLVYVLLPLQQALSLYFFIVAFEVSLESACIGRPLLALQLGGAGQLVLLLLAGALHFALGPEEPAPVAAAAPADHLSQTVF